METTQVMAAIECMLFVAADPVPIAELQRVLQLTDLELRPLLFEMEERYRRENRGIQLNVTEESVQLCSNAQYAPYVQELLQPAQSKPFSQAMLETLAIVAYKQPVTRGDIEQIRGVRCEYIVNQLLQLDMIQVVGKKDTLGKPALLRTTHQFLRHFGLHALTELPNYELYAKGELPVGSIIV